MLSWKNCADSWTSWSRVRSRTGRPDLRRKSQPCATLRGMPNPRQPTSEWLRGLQQQFEELLHHLKIELNEVPAATALSVFALGVLVGRLISK